MPCTCTTPAGLCGATPGGSLACGFGDISVRPWPCLPLGRLSPCGPTWWFSGLWVGDISVLLGPVCLSGACLPVGQALGFGGVGAWLSRYPHLSPPALPPVSSAHWALSAWSRLTPGTHALFPPRCSSLPAPCLEIPKTCSLHLLNFVALCLGSSLGWEAPSSCSSGFYSFPLSPPVTTMTAGRQRRPCPQLLSPRNLLSPRKRPYR